MVFDLNYFKEAAHKVFNIDSPSGYNENINNLLIDLLKELGHNPKLTNKGNVYVKVEGTSNAKTVATSAHVDTLGLMVRSINGDGTLNVTKIGGPQIATLDGEYCKIQTRFGKTYTGTIRSKIKRFARQTQRAQRRKPEARRAGNRKRESAHRTTGTFHRPRTVVQQSQTSPHDKPQLRRSRQGKGTYRQARA